MPLFEGLAPELLEPLSRIMTVRSHPANQTIILQNDWGNSVYFVMAGWVKVRTFNLDGKEVTLNILGPGEVVGEMAALDEAPRSTDVIALTPAKVALMPAKSFIEFLESDSACGVRLAQLISRRLRQINRRLQLREAGSTARVADVLLFLAEFRGHVSRAGVEVPNLPHRELGSLSGLARETVTRILGKLEQKGLIQRDRDRDIVCIPNMDSLEDLLL
ncbi:cyclic nucleotide-binding domain-containing protein [Synechococcus sp. PCC 7336]|uniref:Crp/Fnr family transcriptional regulator n=1 Tax=Synechococcus sp. PCC 7336 TaxID=195250 RepID=UPI000360B4E2